MEKNKVNIEHELRSKSAGFIWSMLSTPEGLAKWLSDEVRLNGDLFTFTWGNVWSDHEIRTSAVIDKKKFDYIRFRWCGEEYKDTYWELKMNKSDVTGDFVLMITDFAPEGEKDTVVDIWQEISVRLDGLRGFRSFVAFVFCVSVIPRCAASRLSPAYCFMPVSVALACRLHALLGRDAVPCAVDCFALRRGRMAVPYTSFIK